MGNLPVGIIFIIIGTILLIVIDRRKFGGGLKSMLGHTKP